MRSILRLPWIALGLSICPTLFAANITFTTAGITCFNISGGGACAPGVNNIWNTNDYLEQTFTGTGLGAVNELGLNLNLTNGLGNGVTETWGIRVNSIQVGTLSFTGPGSGNSLFNQTFNFAAIAGAGSGTDYTIRFQVISPSAAQGTLGLPTNITQTGTLVLNSAAPPTGVPEPSVLLLTGAGLGALLLRRR